MKSSSRDHAHAASDGHGALPMPSTEAEPKSRRDTALAIWKTTGHSSNPNLSNSLLGDMLEIALDDFAAIYKCARGHQIDPTYVRALRHDVLIAVEAAALADGVGRDPRPPVIDGDKSRDEQQ